MPSGSIEERLKKRYGQSRFNPSAGQESMTFTEWLDRHPSLRNTNNDERIKRYEAATSAEGGAKYQAAHPNYKTEVPVITGRMERAVGLGSAAPARPAGGGRTAPARPAGGGRTAPANSKYKAGMSFADFQKASGGSPNMSKEKVAARRAAFLREKKRVGK